VGGPSGVSMLSFQTCCQVDDFVDFVNFALVFFDLNLVSVESGDAYRVISSIFKPNKRGVNDWGYVAAGLYATEMPHI
jgi:hypothetical protein